MPRPNKRKLLERQIPLLPGFRMPKKVIYTQTHLQKKRIEVNTLQRQADLINLKISKANGRLSQNIKMSRLYARTGESAEFEEETKKIREEIEKLQKSHEDIQTRLGKEKEKLNQIVNYLDARKKVGESARELRERAIRILGNRNFVSHTLNPATTAALKKLAEGKRITRAELEDIKYASNEYRIIMGS